MSVGLSYSYAHSSLAEGPKRQEWALVAQDQSSRKEKQVLAATGAGCTTAAMVDPEDPSMAHHQRSVTFPSPQLIRTTG